MIIVTVFLLILGGALWLLDLAMKIMLGVCCFLTAGFTVTYFVVKKKGIYDLQYTDWKKYLPLILRIFLLVEIGINALGIVIAACYLLFVYVIH